MKKAMYVFAILSLCIGMPIAASTQDKGVSAPSGQVGKSLDPQWQKFVAPPLAPGERPDAHRVQFGKQNCMDCHKKETPAGYKQWLGSKHGINNVKCGICHGDANNYRAHPDKAVCIGCHSQQVNNMPAQALVTNCSFCHKSHWFTVHKIKQYERFAPGREDRFHVPGF